MKIKRIKEYFQDIFKPIANAERDPEQRALLTSDLDYSYGLRSPLQNPDGTLVDKNKDLTLYDKMLKDDRIKNVLEIFKKMVLSVGGSFVSPSKETADEEMTQFVDKAFNSMKGIRFWDIFDNLMDSRAYGFKAGELVWEAVDGKLIITNVKFCHSLFYDFDYDEFRNLKDVRVGYVVGNNTAVPAEEFDKKFIYFCNPYVKDGNWYGTSELSDIYEQWYAKKYISKFRSLYLQNYGFPIPVGVYDQVSFSPAEKTKLEKQFEQFQEMEYFLFPGKRGPDGKLNSKVEIQFHKVETTGGSGQFNETIDMIDKQIARKLLIPDKLGFSESPGGSYSLGETQFDALKMFIRDYQGRLEDCINKYVKMVIDYNFANVEKYPEFKFESNDQRLGETMLKLLLEAKVIDKREKWIRQYIGVPEISIEEQAEIDEKKKEDVENQQDIFGRQPFPGQQNPFPPKKKEEDKEEFQANPFFDKDEMNKVYDRFEADFMSEYKRIMFGLANSVIGQVRQSKMVENKSIAGIKDIRMTRAKTEIKNLFSGYLAKLYLNGKTDAIDQVKSRLKKAEKTVMKDYEQFKPEDDELWLDREWVDKYLSGYGDLGNLTKADRQYLQNYRQQAFYVTGETEANVLKIVEKTIASGIRNGLTTENVVAKLQDVLSEETKKYALTIARTNASEAYNSGRMNEFMADDIRPFIEAYEFQAILDDATTDICEGLNGRILYPSDSDFAQYNPPLHFNALLPDVKISCYGGDKEIKDVVVGDYVRTHTGVFRKVYDTMLEYRDEEILEIEIDNGQKIKVTSDHPIMTSDGWKNAGDLTENMEIMYIGHKRAVRYCRICGKEIMIRGKKKPMMYCSKKCSAEGLRTIKNKTCLTCGKEMKGSFKQPISSNRRFCSQKCYFSYKGRTSIETVVFDVLVKLGLIFEEQKKIGKYYVDFCLPLYNIVIEADGNYWHDKKEKWKKRRERDAFITSCGYKIYHIGQDAILGYKFEQDLKKILEVS